MWKSGTGKVWLLVLNGMAVGALGVILTEFTGSRISFRTIALLLVAMAASAGILELLTARVLWRQRRATDGWLIGLGGAVSVVFGLAFFALAFGWIRLGPGSHPDLLWFGCYFGLSAVSMLGLAQRLHSSPRLAH
ncbi:MAG TPA: hypothetical protein VGH38_17780 [Bryobacteraceae bacterium]